MTRRGLFGTLAALVMAPFVPKVSRPKLTIPRLPEWDKSLLDDIAANTFQPYAGVGTTVRVRLPQRFQRLQQMNKLYADEFDKRVAAEADS